MKINRHGAAVLGLAAAGALLLAACGTDNNSAASGSSPSSAGGSSSSASASGISCPSGSANLTLAGSTAQANAISVWAKNVENACSGVNINNGLGGSGAGVTQFEQGSVDFAGSDYPLSATDQPKANQRCKTGDALNLPLVPGPIAVGYNVPGVSGTLNLSAANLAKIFSGKITTWNDPQLVKDNQNAHLPNMPIQTFHRSDTSGTSFNFSNYLANEAKSDWTFGANKQWPGPGGQGDKGSALVSQDVKKTQGGIGYFELSYAQQQKIPFAKVSNAAGQFVELTQANASNFISKAQIVGTGDDLTLSFDYKDTGASDYPNVLVTYEIVCASGNDAAKLPALKSFLSYAASTTGQQAITSQGYVSLPSNIQQKVAATINSLK